MTTTTEARPAAVAGMFYAADPRQLKAEVARHLDAGGDVAGAGSVPKAVIAPHAGYRYSGPVAGRVYRRLKPLAGIVQKVVLLGPSHRVPFRGLALTRAPAYATPLGEVALDRRLTDIALGRPGVGWLDAAHAQEHSLEVHLPFLKAVLGDFTLLPVVAGQAAAGAVADLLEAVWGGPETLIVISTDLSHYLPYEQCRTLDAATVAAIEQATYESLGPHEACGHVPVSGLLEVVRRRGLSVETVDVRTSGDTAGPKDRVVGYGAWAVHEPEQVTGQAQ